jgi:membrane protease YdiL (CAAX protease family)
MKKNIPYILAMILMIPFFVLSVLSMGSQGSGKEILNTNMSWTVVKEDGVIESREGMPVDVTIEEDGNYNLSFSWDVEEPGFFTGMTVKDAAGNTVYSTSAFQLQISNESIYLKKGNYTINTEFFATEDEFREFAGENNAFKSESALNDYISAIGFDTFNPDSEASFSFSVQLAKPYTSPAWVKVLTALTGLAIITLCIIILITSKSADATTSTPNTTTSTPDTINRGLDNIGLAYAIFSIVITCVQLLVSVGFGTLFPGFVQSNSVIFSLMLVMISVDMIGFPLIFGLTGKIPTRDIPKTKIGFFGFIPFIFMTFAILVPGMIVGTLVHTLMTIPFGGNGSNAVAELLVGSNPIPRIIVIGILAPIFEELIFRKLLIDRLSRYGSFIAIIVSGLFFGLFHGNFSQFFFATGIGILFAFLYSKTGKIHLTIILHMIVNMYTSVITTTAVQNLVKVNPNMDLSQEFLMAHPEALAAAGFLGLAYAGLGLFAFIGIICFIVFAAKKKFRLEKIEGEPTKAEALKALATSKYVWLFILSTIGLFVFSYLPVILGI